MISAYKQECLRLRFIQARNNLDKFIRGQAATLLQMYRINGIEAVEDAPSTYEELLEHYKRDVVWGGKPFKVYSGGMDDTIYMTRYGNHCFRFVHDFKHIDLKADFSYGGEVEVAMTQIYEVAKQFGPASDEVVLMEADTIGQMDFFHDMGMFVTNQREFVWGEFVRKLG